MTRSEARWPDCATGWHDRCTQPTRCGCPCHTRTAELHRIEWQHPRLGRITESVCPTHESEVLVALKVLGIGSGGMVEDEKDYCDRCCHPRQRAFMWLREVAECICAHEEDQ